MNAPDSVAALRPEKSAANNPGLVAWDMIRTLVGFDTHGESDIAALGRSCSETADHGKVSFGTEAGLFHEAAISAIICGPGHIAQAHQPNEWVAVDQLKRCEAFMKRLVERVALA